MENTLHNGIVDLQTCIATAIASITPDDVNNTYIIHCQIYMDSLLTNVVFQLLKMLY